MFTVSFIFLAVITKVIIIADSTLPDLADDWKLAAPIAMDFRVNLTHFMVGRVTTPRMSPIASSANVIILAISTSPPVLLRRQSYTTAITCGKEDEVEWITRAFHNAMN